MTPAQLADILDKADAVHTAKADYDTAKAENNVAIVTADNARMLWQTGVDAGDDEAALTALIEAHVAAEVLRAETSAAEVSTKFAYEAAVAALETAKQLVIQEAIAPP